MTDGEKGNRQYYFGILIIGITWFLIWTLLPVLLLKNAYIDVLENIVWARHFQFGYDKNPYFGPWLTHCAYLLSGKSLWISYLLSQVSVMIALICVWKLARKLFPQIQYAFIAVTLLLLIPFYSSSATEFNDDVIEISLWAVTIYFFYNAVRNQRRIDWLIVGLFAGLSFMTKYYGIVLFGSMAVFLLASKEGRKSFSHSGIYYCAAVFLLLSIPNLIWLMQNNMISIFYALERADVMPDTTWKTHLINPFKFLLRVIEILSALIITFYAIFSRREKMRTPIARFDIQFITVLCFGPLVLTFIFSLISGGNIRFTWITPCFSLLGLFLLAVWQPVISPTRIKILLAAIAIFAVICVGGFSHKAVYDSPYIREACRYETFPGYAVSIDLTRQWQQKYGKPVKYVIGARRETCNFAVYSPDQPIPYFDANPKFCPWIDENDITRHGAVIFWQGQEQNKPKWLKKIIEKYPDRIDFNPSQNYPRATQRWLNRFFGAPKNIIMSSIFIRPEQVTVDPKKESFASNK